MLAIAVTLIVLIRRAQRRPPHKRRAAYLQIILGAAVVGVIILTLMGKMHWLGAAITGLLVVARQMLPLLIRLLPMLGSLRGQAQNGSKQACQTKCFWRNVVILIAQPKALACESSHVQVDRLA